MRKVYPIGHSLALPNWAVPAIPAGPVLLVVRSTQKDIKKAVGRILHVFPHGPVLRPVARRRCLRIFRLVVKNTQTRISYNSGRIAAICNGRQEGNEDLEIFFGSGDYETAWT